MLVTGVTTGAQSRDVLISTAPHIIPYTHTPLAPQKEEGAIPRTIDTAALLVIVPGTDQHLGHRPTMRVKCAGGGVLLLGQQC